MQFLDFEKPLEELTIQLDKIKSIADKNEVDMSASVVELKTSIEKTREKIYKNLTPWQRVQLSRHPSRPYTEFYIEQICDNYKELHGDRNVGDDKAIIGGMAEIEGEHMMIIGHQKGKNTKMRQLRNFGMANPEGYRKALRLMKIAEKFNRPIVTFIDTPGAFPGLEAEERGQGEAIARNLFEMFNLNVPIICIIIGEGASGGALGIGVGNKVFMLENTWYSVISPESCSSILWRSWDYKETAANALKLTPDDMLKQEIIDGIIPEPLGGAHSDEEQMFDILRIHLTETLAELKQYSSKELAQMRQNKFLNIGVFKG